MASIFVNDSHSPSPKGAYGYLLKYPKLGNGEYSDMSRNVGYKIIGSSV